MINFGVSLKKQAELDKIFERYSLKESDIKEQFIHSSGKGGQNVNKVSTAVYLKHLPTGIEIKCFSERSQGLNRFLARRRLAQKIGEQIFGDVLEKQQVIEKIRKQKRKRSKRAKGKILRNKKIMSNKNGMSEEVGC
jgi:protein subunit release factor B